MVVLDSKLRTVPGLFLSIRAAHPPVGIDGVCGGVYIIQYSNTVPDRLDIENHVCLELEYGYPGTRYLSHTV